MKINKDVKRKVSNRPLFSTGSKKEAKEIAKTEKDFKSHMMTSRANLVMEELEELKKKIEIKGDKLVLHLTWENFLEYRDAVKDFMKIYIKESRVLKEVPGVGFKDKRKIYTLIDRVDQELDKLANAVLEGEKGKIKAISSITEIRGLLMDNFQ